MRAIDADAIKYRPIPHVALFGDVKTKQDTVTRGEIDEMPTVEAEPVRHGHWIEHPFSAVFEKVHSKDQIVCSCCEEAFNAFFNETERFKYCPNCGAKMDEVKDE